MSVAPAHAGNSGKARRPRTPVVGIVGIGLAVTIVALALALPSSDAADQSTPPRPPSPPPRDAVARLLASAPPVAQVGYAAYAAGSKAPTAIGAGSVRLSSCSEDLWVAYRSPDSPPFPSADSLSAMATLLAETFPSASQIPSTDVAIAHTVTLDGRVYHQGVVPLVAGPQAWTEDPHRAAGPFRSPGFSADGLLGSPLCEQIAALARTLEAPVPLTSPDAVAAAGLTAPGDDELRDRDATGGVTRTVARYSRSRLKAQARHRAWDVVVKGMGERGARARRLIRRYDTISSKLPDKARIEFIQRDGVLIGFQVRELSQGDSLEFIQLVTDDAVAQPVAPTDARRLKMVPASPPTSVTTEPSKTKAPQAPKTGTSKTGTSKTGTSKTGTSAPAASLTTTPTTTPTTSWPVASMAPEVRR